MTAERTGEARAKLLLFGEHAAVYGHPAVGLALPWSLRARLVPQHGWDLPGLGRHEPAVRTLVDRLAAMAADRGLEPPAPGRLAIETRIPLGNGFGSSGALCAALVNLFWPRLPLADRDKLAWEAEAQFHGTPSGIDTALALRTGWWALDTATRPVTATALPDPGLALVVAAVTRESDTKTLVAHLARRRASGDETVDLSLGRLGALAGQAARELALRRTEGLGSLVTQARAELRSLGLESSAQGRILDAGIEDTGALAGKLSGAGGGGAFFLVYPDRQTAQAALPSLLSQAPPALWTLPPELI